MKKQLLDFIAKAVIEIHRQGKKTMNDVSALNDTMDALATKVAESNETLAGLAMEVMSIRGDLARTDIQVQINKLQDKAKVILASLTAAEDKADDALPIDEETQAALLAAQTAEAEAAAKTEAERIAAADEADRVAAEAAAKALSDAAAATVEAPQIVAAPVAGSPEFTIGDISKVN